MGEIKEGNRIVIVDKLFSDDPYKNNDCFTVIGVDEDGDVVETEELGVYLIYSEEFELLEGEE